MLCANEIKFMSSHCFKRIFYGLFYVHYYVNVNISTLFHKLEREKLFLVIDKKI